MDLVQRLIDQTQELKDAFIQKTIEWSTEEYKRLREFASDYENNYHVSKERKYHSLPSCILSGKTEEYISSQVDKAEKHYTKSVAKLADRILKKGLNEKNIEMSTSYLDPNISTSINDGQKTVRAFTIIAGGAIQKPHYRYLVK